MRLWQKISLISLAFVMLAIQITQYRLLARSFDNAVLREKQNAVAVHEALCASLANHAAYQSLKTGTVLLSTKESDELLQKTITTEITAASSVHVLRDETLVTAAGVDIFSGSPDIDLLQMAADVHSGNAFSVITDVNSIPHLIICSDMRIEAVTYKLYTAYDIADIYSMRAKELQAAKSAGLLCGAVISAVLFLLMRHSLKPMRTAVYTIQEAANGNYDLRLPETGSEEMRVLARSINHMSACIDDREKKLMEIADSRKRFADAMAHEMKTPLTSILGFADILRIQRTVSDEQRREFADHIVQEAKRLRELSAKLLQLASADGTQLDISAVPVAQLFADTAASFRPILEQRGIDLEITHTDAVLYVDRELFLSLLYNLIDNAVKASADNTVIRLVQSGDNGSVTVSVTDEGIGMKPDTLRRATEAFYMEDKVRSRKSGGAGLGLALCESICRKHGGKMEIRSVYREGTTVAVHMDAAQFPPAQMTDGKEREILE